MADAHLAVAGDGTISTAHLVMTLLILIAVCAVVAAVWWALEERPRWQDAGLWLAFVAICLTSVASTTYTEFACAAGEGPTTNPVCHVINPLFSLPAMVVMGFVIRLARKDQHQRQAYLYGGTLLALVLAVAPLLAGIILASLGLQVAR